MLRNKLNLRPCARCLGGLRRLMPGGYGGMVTFACRGGAPAARAVADRVRLVANAPSLGGVESLLSLPYLTSHAGLTKEI